MPAVLCQHAAVPFVWPVALLGTDPTSKFIVRQSAPKLQALAKLQDECILSDVTIIGKDDCRIKALAIPRKTSNNTAVSLDMGSIPMYAVVKQCSKIALQQKVHTVVLSTLACTLLLQNDCI